MKTPAKEECIKILEGSDVSDNMISRSKAVFNFFEKAKNIKKSCLAM